MYLKLVSGSLIIARAPVIASTGWVQTAMVSHLHNLWLCAAAWENVPSDMCAQQRLRSACASAQSDQSLRCPHEETSCPWRSKMRPVKTLIRQREWAGCSKSSLVAHVRRYVFWRCGWFMLFFVSSISFEYANVHFCSVQFFCVRLTHFDIQSRTDQTPQGAASDLGLHCLF